MTTATVQGGTVKVGDHVGFKSDVEQYGKIIAINRTPWGTSLTLESANGFSGDYIGGQDVTTELASDCWVD